MEMTPSEQDLDSATFRDVLASYPAGVVVVTAIGADSRPAGVTVTAFCSVSAVPPLILVCIDKASRTLTAIQSAGGFTVNILAAGREELAGTFASKRVDKFADAEWDLAARAGGGPILRADAAAYLVCVVENAVEAGDHWIFVGRPVEAGRQADQHLLYHRRQFSAVG